MLTILDLTPGQVFQFVDPAWDYGNSLCYCLGGGWDPPEADSRFGDPNTIWRLDKIEKANANHNGELCWCYRILLTCVAQRKRYVRLDAIAYPFIEIPEVVLHETQRAPDPV